MKNATCYLHGRDLRPSLCADCARCEAPAALPPTRTLRLTDDDFNALERTYDAKGKINFRALRPLVRPVSSDPWAA